MFLSSTWIFTHRVTVSSIAMGKFPGPLGRGWSDFKVRQQAAWPVALRGKVHQCCRSPHLQSVEFVVHRGQQHPDVALGFEPGRTDGAALAQHDLRHQLKEGREQQFSGVLLLRHLLEPAVEPRRVEFTLQHSTHHHRQRGFVREALEDRAEVHLRLISGWGGRVAIVCAAVVGWGSLKSLVVRHVHRPIVTG